MQRNNNNCLRHAQLHSCWFGITLLQHTPRYWNNDNK